MFTAFWGWYKRNYKLNLAVAAGLFLLQIFHLYWLTADIVAFKLLGKTFLHLPPFWEYITILVDYTEIPALITTSLVYIAELRDRKEEGGRPVKAWLYLLFLNIQWVHLFWITDEFVVSSFTEGAKILPIWLAWIAILIDYLELPVIVDIFKKAYREIKKGPTVAGMQHVFEEEN